MLFYQIILGDFVNASPSLFDIYQRKKDGEYVCILQCREPFSFSLIEELRSQGTSFVYIRIEDKERYLSFCSQMAKKTLLQIFDRPI